MIHVIASLHIKEGHLAEFIDIFKSNIPNVLEEEGCLEYAPTVDMPSGLPPQVMDANAVTIIEKWHSLEDLKRHLAAPHMRAYRENVKDLVVDLSLKVLGDA
jgi:quinol monooxygenase YgiN